MATLQKQGFTRTHAISMSYVGWIMAKEKVCGQDPEFPEHVAWALNREVTETGLSRDTIFQNALKFSTVYVQQKSKEPGKQIACKGKEPLKGTKD